MALTVATDWRFPETRGQHPGDTISTGAHAELATIIEQYNRAFSHGVATQAAVLCWKKQSGVTLTASYVAIGRGRRRIWGTYTRWAISAYGAQFNVRIKIGGQIISSVTRSSAIEGWSTSTINPGSVSMTVDSLGFADFHVEASYTATPGQALRYIVVEEHFPSSSDLPDYGDADADTSWHYLDDGVYADDTPLDAWMIQAMDDGTRQAEYWIGCTGQLHLYPTITAQRQYLASVFWRCTGPYLITAAPWATHARVVVTGVATSPGVEVFAFSEAEDPGEVRADRVVTFSTTEKSEVFDGLKLSTGRPSKLASGQPTRVWIAFRSKLGTTQASDLLIGFQSTSDHARMYVEDDDYVTALIPLNYIVAGVTASDESALHTTAKGSLTTQQPASYFDLAHIEGTASVFSGEDVPITVSPHPDSGYIDIAHFHPYIGTSGTIYAATFDLVAMGTMSLFGVYIEALSDAPVRRKLARPGDRPSAGLWLESVERLTEIISQSTPLLYMAHWGTQSLVNDTSAAGPPAVNTSRDGKYIFFDGRTSSPTTYTIPIPISQDPNQGETTGLLVSKIYAQVDLLVVEAEQQSAVEEVKMSLWISASGGSSPGTEAFWPQMIMPKSVVQSGSVTSTDAFYAARASSLDKSPNPDVQREHAYTQQYTWPEEARSERCPWRLSPVAEYTEPGTYPTILELHIKCWGATDGSSPVYVYVAVCGLRVWCGSRI